MSSSPSNSPGPLLAFCKVFVAVILEFNVLVASIHVDDDNHDFWSKRVFFCCLVIFCGSRLHLELCGNPIANDPCYGGELFFGEREKREAAIAAVEKMRAQGYHPLSKMPHLRSLGMGASVADNHHDTCSSNTNEEQKTVEEETESLARLPNETDEEYTIRHCRYCKIDNEAEKLEGALHCDGIWLHALQYSSKSDWKFRAPIPSWAKEYSSKIEAIMEKVDDGTL